MGSSPLTRGILKLTICYIVPHRFIPAHAGNTCRTWRNRGKHKVHPRSRGEYRGTGACILWCLRFIPAHAGNTMTTAFVISATGVHPRSRGEYNRKKRNPKWRFGSSPLTRGIHVGITWKNSGKRFIPAHAGNTYFEVP